MDTRSPSNSRRSRKFRWLGLLLAMIQVGMGSGCVQRRMVIRSNPPGAIVYVDDYEVGRTPVTVGFTYYGTRRIRLALDGYETLTVLQPVPAPWYEYPPLDFFSENVVPGELRDSRDFCFQLRPQMLVPPEQLLQRAEQLRRGQPTGAPLGLSRSPAMQPALPAGEPLPLPEPSAAPMAVGPQPGQMQVQPGQMPFQPGQLPPTQLPAGAPPNAPPGGWQ